MTDLRDLDAVAADMQALLAEIQAIRGAEIGAQAVLANGLPGNVASGELIESAWGNSVANFVTKENAAHTSQGPYVGTWPTGSSYRQLQYRTGHQALQTSAYGDCSWTFPTAFTTGVIAVQVTPIQTGKDQFWYPVLSTMSLSGTSILAVASQNMPFATAHPPSQPNVWTVNGIVTFDYIAIGI